ncbi:MAG: 2-oxo acid dehydrogenase subunit E2 [Sphaerochaetaceae bacterium]|jgi:hypothetical protein|nr:2-oxo acid dehydrogenase subunit E2 [Sphaerochaetaceae bacterium]MDD3162925.1 2-oxo acid dehydrogenase subunit E2 [Sphaerochaetaceae bacterium]MDD4006486.1 2-oxo acid dehydrogenase subunit E2 [Sphaerochaetaceae bacterium]MDD4397788.1 2-oxo acid dehydrogenase subunit E2 [Sphaerochaetaceae bacterium]
MSKDKKSVIKYNKDGTRKQTHKDRKDGWFVRGQDALHMMMPFLMPNRADNEAVLNEDIDITHLLAFVDKKNSENPKYNYTIFHVVVAALAKVLKLRPHMNRFYAGNRLFDRKFISFSFVAKEKFKDDAHEALLILRYKEGLENDCPLEQIHDHICKRVYEVKHDFKEDPTTKYMNLLTSLPKPILAFVMWTLRKLDEHGHYPMDLMNSDPDFASVFISNLGSIKMNASYHHLANWGTNSFFLVIGEKKLRPVFNDDGTYAMKPVLPLGFTIDERIADGLYFAGSIRLFKHLLANPELLEKPIEEEVDYD